MMLHRHFEKEPNQNITTTDDLNRNEPYVSEIFPPDVETEQQKKRGRKKKSEE